MVGRENGLISLGSSANKYGKKFESLTLNFDEFGTLNIQLSTLSPALGPLPRNSLAPMMTGATGKGAGKGAEIPTSSLMSLELLAFESGILRI